MSDDTDLAAAGIPAVAAKKIVEVAQNSATQVNQDVVDTANEALTTAQEAQTTAEDIAATADAALEAATAAESATDDLNSTYSDVTGRLTDNERVDADQDSLILQLMEVLESLEARIVTLESATPSERLPAHDDLAISTTVPIVGVASPSANITPARGDLTITRDVPTLNLSSSVYANLGQEELEITTSVPLVVSSEVELSVAMTATFTGLPQGTVIFAEDTATVADSYIEPSSAAFVQQHRIARNSALPTVTVHFCRDQGTGRREVWVYHGTLYSHPAADLGAHTVTIMDGATTLAVVNLTYHGHRTWWRWAPSPRPLIRTMDDIVDARLVPPYSTTLASSDGNTISSLGAWPPAPMSNAGITRYMPGTGERNDIGPMTAVQSKYACTRAGTDLTNMLIQAEAAAAIPFHWLDEGTGRYVDIYQTAGNRYLISNHDNETGNPGWIACTTTEKGNGGVNWQVQNAHMPETVCLAGLLTGDPYYVMMAQGKCSFWFTTWARWDDGGVASGIGPHVNTEIRGRAWRARDYIVAWLLTPDTTPAWLQPRTYFRDLLLGYAKLQKKQWITNGNHAQTTFRAAHSDGPRGNFPEDFWCDVLGWWKWCGAPGAEVDELVAWKLDAPIARATARNGFHRQYFTWYAADHYGTNPFVSAANWGQVASVGSWPTPQTANFCRIEDAISGPDWWYVSYGTGALEWAIIHGLVATEAAAGLDYVRNQFTVNARTRYRKYAWTYERAALT